MQSSNNSSDVSVQMALRQPPILQAIFDHLQLDDIKSCSLVNHEWKNEAYVRIFNPIKIGNEKGITSFPIEKFRRIFKKHGRVIRKLILNNVKFTDEGERKYMYCVQNNIMANLTSLIIINHWEVEKTGISLRLDLLTGLKCLHLDSMYSNIIIHVVPSDRKFRPVDLKLKRVVIKPDELLLNDFVDFRDAQRVEIDYAIFPNSRDRRLSISLDLSEHIIVETLKLNSVIINNPGHINWKYKKTVELVDLISEEKIPLSIALRQVD